MRATSGRIAGVFCSRLCTCTSGHARWPRVVGCSIGRSACPRGMVGRATRSPAVRWRQSSLRAGCNFVAWIARKRQCCPAPMGARCTPDAWRWVSPSRTAWRRRFDTCVAGAEAETGAAQPVFAWAAWRFREGLQCGFVSGRVGDPERRSPVFRPVPQGPTGFQPVPQGHTGLQTGATRGDRALSGRCTLRRSRAQQRAGGRCAARSMAERCAASRPRRGSIRLPVG